MNIDKDSSQDEEEIFSELKSLIYTALSIQV